MFPLCILVQLKQSSGLSKYMNVLERNFYAAGQNLPQLRKKLNHLHKISDTQMSELMLTKSLLKL